MSALPAVVRRRSPASAEGFTLIEMLIAMGLLATLGTFLVALLRNGFELYEKGDSRGDLYTNGTRILEMLEDDLLAVHSGPDGRLIIESGVSGASTRGDTFVLRLVRDVPEGEQNHRVLRRAGTRTGTFERNYDGTDPGPEGRLEIAPPSGLEEVAYALVAEPSDSADRPGILTLYRGVHAPAFDSKSFFDPEKPVDEAWIRERLRPVATDIIGLWVLCYSQASEDWSEEEVLNGSAASLAQSLASWDSTRGILPKSVFPLARSQASANDARDDVYPQRVRIVLQVARGGRPDARLRAGFNVDDSALRLRTTKGLPNEESFDRYLKLGNEWLQVLQTDSSDARVARRRRHTVLTQATVPAGAPVYAGKTFRKTMAIPGRRSFWVEDGK